MSAPEESNEHLGRETGLVSAGWRADSTLNPPNQPTIEELMRRARTSSRGRNRFNDEQRLQIVQELAEFGELTRTANSLREKYGLIVSVTSLLHYRETEPWKTIIHRFKTKYLEGVIHVPIANKRWRVERLQDIFEEVRGKMFLTKDERGKYQILLQTLEQVHQEVNPHKRETFLESFQQQFNVIFSGNSGERLGLDGLRSAPGSEVVPPESK